MKNLEKMKNLEQPSGRVSKGNLVTQADFSKIEKNVEK